MIPKIIHYCWFGGKEKPDDVRLCIDSWKKFLPEYELMEWNESNFSINESNMFVKDAYKCKKWAFVSDYVRLKALYEYGGIYFDTDVEVFQSFDGLLDNSCFFGFESKDYVATAVMGSEKQNKIIEEFLGLYSQRSFLKKDGEIDMTTNVFMLTELLRKYGLVRNGKKQVLRDCIIVYPQSFFASNDFKNIFGKYKEGIYAYHHCLASWYDYPKGRGRINLFRHYIVGILRNTLGTDLLVKIRK